MSLSHGRQYKDPEKLELRRSRVFRKIEKDIKDKHRKRRANHDGPRGNHPSQFSSVYHKVGVERRPEETYIDKDRAIAVGIGAEDLKGSILKHRGELSRNNKEAGSVELAQNIDVLLQQAHHELKLGDPERALSYMLQGIEMAPENVECRILRTRCLLSSNQCKEALQEANLLIKDYNARKNPEVLMVKGDALYSMGCFEHSLVNYHRALEFVSSKEKGKLVNRISRTELAIVNSIGITNPSCFDDVADYLAESGTAGTQMAKGKSSDGALLSELAVDKTYLENLLNQLNKNRGSKCMRRATNETQSAITFLQERSEFWIQNAPKLEKKSMYKVN